MRLVLHLTRRGISHRPPQLVYKTGLHSRGCRLAACRRVFSSISAAATFRSPDVARMPSCDARLLYHSGGLGSGRRARCRFHWCSPPSSGVPHRATSFAHFLDVAKRCGSGI